jgi:hypothetical protein
MAKAKKAKKAAAPKKGKKPAEKKKNVCEFC